MNQSVAIVTGSNRGLGYATVKALCERFNGIVYLTARDKNKGLESIKNLEKLGLHAKFHQLDISERKSVKAFADDIKKEHGGVDVLINNAAVLEWDAIYPDYETAKRTIDNNYKSLLLIEEYVYPLLRSGARVVNVCSAAGHLSNLRNEKWINILKSKDLTVEQINEFVNDYLKSVKNGSFKKEDFADDGKHAEFRVSKIAVAALTMIQAKKYRDKNISINLVHPGHVKTDMACGGGVLEPEEAAKSILYYVFDASPNLTGTFMWCDKKMIDWYYEGGNYFLSGLW